MDDIDRSLYELQMLQEKNKKDMKVWNWILIIVIPIWLFAQIGFVLSKFDKPKKETVKPKEPTIESTIRLKESGCTYLVFSNGQIVPEYGVDGKVVGCGE